MYKFVGLDMNFAIFIVFKLLNWCIIHQIVVSQNSFSLNFCEYVPPAGALCVLIE